jgi:hypothetical protein
MVVAEVSPQLVAHLRALTGELCLPLLGSGTGSQPQGGRALTDAQVSRASCAAHHNAAQRAPPLPPPLASTRPG